MGIEVRPAAGHWDDFASFMVPRKPGGGGCVCMAYRHSGLDMPSRIAHMRALCAGEPGPGVLVYVDGEVAGWCSVAPKSTYRALVNSVLEGYPVDPGGERIDQTSAYVGTVGLFAAHGFSRVGPTAGRRGGKPRWLVRRVGAASRPVEAPG